MARNNLAIAYVDDGQLNEAIALHKRVLSDRERVRGEFHPETTGSRHNLASTYNRIGKLDDAISLWEAALAERWREGRPATVAGNPLNIVG